MLALAFKNETYNVDGYNVHFNEQTKEYEMWITRKNGNTKMVASSKNEKDILGLKKAMDYAIDKGEKLLEVGE